MSIFISFVFLLNSLISILGQEMINGKHVAHVSTSSSSSSKMVLQEMQGSITRLEHEQHELRNKNKQIREVIQKVTKECAAQVDGIYQQQKNLIKGADSNIQTLNELVLRIHKEEEHHVRLKVELKSYSYLFDLWKLKHDVVQGNLQLMSGRRVNGTSERCRQVTAEVDAAERQVARARSAFFKRITRITKKKRMSFESIQINVQQTLLNRREDERTSLSRLLESAQKHLTEEQEACERKRLGAQGLLKDTQTMMRTAEQSKTLLQSDLNIAQTYSKEVMLQIQSVKKLLGDYRVKIQEMSRALNGYGSDRKCYAKVENYN